MINKDGMIKFGIDCSFTLQILSHIPITIDPDWISTISTIGSNLKIKNMKLYVGVAVYHIWLEPNSQVHLAPNKPARVLVRIMKQMARENVHTCHEFQKIVVRDPSVIAMYPRFALVGPL